MSQLLPSLIRLVSCVRHFPPQAKMSLWADCLKSGLILDSLYLFSLFLPSFLLFYHFTSPKSAQLFTRHRMFSRFSSMNRRPSTRFTKQERMRSRARLKLCEKMPVRHCQGDDMFSFRYVGWSPVSAEVSWGMPCLSLRLHVGSQHPRGIPAF